MTLKKSVIKEIEILRQKAFSLKKNDSDAFEQLALEVYSFQYRHNTIYKSFVDALNIPEVKSLQQIPFLPISFFKSHEIVIEGNYQNEIRFRSSGTGSNERSLHIVPDPTLYEESFTKTYVEFIGQPKDQVILALLPNYLEQGDSSLVYMVDNLIELSQHPLSGFLLHDPSELKKRYDEALALGKDIVIFGVSYALLDLAEKKIDLSKATIIETGGMKGRRKEMTKDELHTEISTGLKVPFVSSEYGMSELLSQAYSNKNGIFTTPPLMKILIRDVNDPLSLQEDGKTGGINVIDFANLYSCCFIATQDLGKIESDGFRIIGRFDNSDIRGCNLLVE